MENMDYIDMQFERIGFYDIKFYPIDDYDIPKIKLTSFRGKTNWMNISDKQVRAIYSILTN